MDKTAARFNTLRKGMNYLRRGSRAGYTGLRGKARAGYAGLAKRRKPIAIGTGLFGGGAAAGIAGSKYAPAIKNRLGKKSTVRYANKTKSEVIWDTYPGGPVLRGPTSTMKKLFKTGKRDRKQGLLMLAKLLKSGQIRKVGTVSR